MYFPVSGIEVFPAIPFLVAFIISFFTSMGGVSGAFLLLPFQVSVLGFTSPSVSSTNLVYNIIAIPGGVYRYVKERRMAWPLAWVIIAGTLPGVFAGAVIRVVYLPDPRVFKLFAGCVLFYIGVRLLYDLTRKQERNSLRAGELEQGFNKRIIGFYDIDHNRTNEDGIRTLKFSLTEYVYEFYGEKFSFNTMSLLVLTAVVGLIGGIYGIGGGAIIAPFLITVFGLPVYTIAGATLLATFFTSIAGVIFYAAIAYIYGYTDLVIAPDWNLGILFGMGGFLGVYCGARMQKYFPAKLIKAILGLVLFFLSVIYILNFFNQCPSMSDWMN